MNYQSNYRYSYYEDFSNKGYSDAELEEMRMREAMHAIIQKMSIEELKEIFRVEVYDPRKIETYRDEYVLKLMHELRQMKQVQVDVSIETSKLSTH